MIIILSFDLDYNDPTIMFGLILAFSGDSERDRFWDHELGGPVVASAGAIDREKCAELCGEFTTTAAQQMPKRGKRHRRMEEAEEEAEAEAEGEDRGKLFGGGRRARNSAGEKRPGAERVRNPREFGTFGRKSPKPRKDIYSEILTFWHFGPFAPFWPESPHFGPLPALIGFFLSELRGDLQLAQSQSHRHGVPAGRVPVHLRAPTCPPELRLLRRLPDLIRVVPRAQIR